MKLTILLFVAVAFVASSEAVQRPQDPNSILRSASTAAPAKTSEVNKKTQQEGEKVKDILYKLVNGTYNYPNDVVSSCFGAQTEDFNNKTKKLVEAAEKAAEIIKKEFNDPRLNAPLENYVGAMKKLQNGFWSLIVGGNFTEALAVDDGIVEKVKTAKTQMTKIIGEENEDSLTSHFGPVMEEGYGSSRKLGEKIMECIRSSQLTAN